MTSIFISNSGIAQSGEEPFVPQNYNLPTTPHELAERLRQISSVLFPVSNFYTDLQGRIIRLWKYNDQLIASILQTDGTITVLSGKRIHNALQPLEVGSVLLKKIEQVAIRSWHLAYLDAPGDIFVWPFLRASGGIQSLKEALEKTASIRDHIEKTKKPATKTEPEKSHIKAAERELKEKGYRPHVGEIRQWRLRCCNNIRLGREEYRRACAELNKPGVIKPPAERKKLMELMDLALNVQKDAKALLTDPETRSRGFPLTRHFEKTTKPDPRTTSQLKSTDPSRLTPTHPFHPKNYSKELDRKTPGPIDSLMTVVAEDVRRKRDREEDGNGGGGGRGFPPVKPGPTASNRLDAKSFKEMVQQNRLAASYNASHPDSQIVQKGSAGGTIGGIGNEVGIIKGLFESLSSFEESRHIFFVRTADGKKPCSGIKTPDSLLYQRNIVKLTIRYHLFQNA